MLPRPEQAASAFSDDVYHRVGDEHRAVLMTIVSGVEGEENVEREVREGSERRREGRA